MVTQNLGQTRLINRETFYFFILFHYPKIHTPRGVSTQYRQTVWPQSNTSSKGVQSRNLTLKALVWCICSCWKPFLTSASKQIYHLSNTKANVGALNLSMNSIIYTSVLSNFSLYNQIIPREGVHLKIIKIYGFRLNTKKFWQQAGSFEPPVVRTLCFSRLFQ